MPLQRWQRLCLPVTLTLLTPLAAHTRTPSGLRWEKIHVYRVAPSVVFAKLGLTHSTKNGYTRDGKQGIPDPGFPPGLTDVVPYNADKVLLVRGTAGGLSLFRARVTAADVPSVPMHLHAELLAGDTSLGTAEQDGINDAVPQQVSLGDGGAARVYQVTERANPDGTVWIACRVRLPLPPPPEVAPTGPVFVPELVWTDPQSRKIRPGETVTFEDFASVRRAAAQKLGVTGADAGNDYTLRITLTPIR